MMLLGFGYDVIRSLSGLSSDFTILLWSYSNTFRFCWVCRVNSEDAFLAPEALLEMTPTRVEHSVILRGRASSPIALRMYIMPCRNSQRGTSIVPDLTHSWVILNNSYEVLWIPKQSWERVRIHKNYQAFVSERACGQRGDPEAQRLGSGTLVRICLGLLSSFS